MNPIAPSDVPPPLSPVTVGPDSYLTLHYRLADLDGTEYVSTFDLSPATLQMGSGQLAETLEGCLRELSDSSALFDFNHPLAGKAIRFEVEVIAIM